MMFTKCFEGFFNLGHHERSGAAVRLLGGLEPPKMTYDRVYFPEFSANEFKIDYSPHPTSGRTEARKKAPLPGIFPSLPRNRLPTMSGARPGHFPRRASASSLGIPGFDRD